MQEKAGWPGSVAEYGKGKLPTGKAQTLCCDVHGIPVAQFYTVLEMISRPLLSSFFCSAAASARLKGVAAGGSTGFASREVPAEPPWYLRLEESTHARGPSLFGSWVEIPGRREARGSHWLGIGEGSFQVSVGVSWGFMEAFVAGRLKCGSFKA